MNQLTKYKLILWLLGVLIVAILFLKFKGCEVSKTVDTPNHDSIYHAELKEDSIISKAKERDSILVVHKIKYIVRYKTVYDSLYITDTLCQQSLITLYNAFGDLNSANDSLISNKDTIINSLVRKLGDKQSHITIDSTRIVALIDTIGRVKRRAFWNGFKWGFGSGVVADEAVNVGAKFIK